MQGFDEATVLLPSANGLGYTGEKRVESKLAQVDLLDPTLDIAVVREERRRRELEAEALGKRSAAGASGAGDGFEDLGSIAARQAAAAGVRLSLREQLRLNAEQKDADWKEKHNPFRAPEGISQEDYNLYLDLEDQKQSKHAAQREQEAADYAAFSQAMKKKELGVTESTPADSAAPQKVALDDPTQVDPSLGFAHLTATSASASLLASAVPSSPAAALVATTPMDVSAATAALPVLVLKRKHSEAADKEKKHHHKHHHKKAKPTDKATEPTSDTPDAAPTSQAKPATATETATEPAGGSALAGLGLGAYGSDDE